MPDKNSSLVDALFKVGAHFGFSRSRRHATMKDYVFGSKNKTDILDLTKTAPLLEKALTFVNGLGAHGKTILFVGGKPEMQEFVRSAAKEAGMPYVAGRWLGGTLTNFSEIKKRIKRMVELTTDRESGALAKKYTKRERVMIDREIDRLEGNFVGLVSMEKLPDALVVVDTRREFIPVREANNLGIPVIGILNSDSDLSVVTHPIIGNDASRTSVEFFLNSIVETLKEGRKGFITKKEEPEKKVPASAS